MLPRRQTCADREHRLHPHGDTPAHGCTRPGTPVSEPYRGCGGNHSLGRGVREQITDHALHDSHARRREPRLAQTADEFRQVQAGDLCQCPLPETRVHMPPILLGVILQRGRRQVLRRKPAQPPVPHHQPRLHTKTRPQPDGELLLLRVLLRRTLPGEPRFWFFGGCYGDPGKGGAAARVCGHHAELDRAHRRLPGRRTATISAQPGTTGSAASSTNTTTRPDQHG
jgi:hypothetical protein